ncbi:MAG: hypothetical protein U9Q83_06450 [Bacteroidota bacterium]|nr:hypothetical protein [Bacteroidota bacterium]
MKRLSVFLLVFLFLECAYSQEFTELDFSNFKKYSLEMLNNDGLDLKVIFSETVIASLPKNKKINQGEIAYLEGFSKEKLDCIIGGIETSIPFLKISLDNQKIWVKGADAFIFNDNLDNNSFSVNNVEYKIYLAANLKFIVDTEEIFTYLGYKLIIVKNTSTQEYFFLKNADFPNQLQGHSYNSDFVYLQNDSGVNEKIIETIVLNDYVELKILVQYQDGRASYSIIFCADELSTPVEYKSITVDY